MSKNEVRKIVSEYIHELKKNKTSFEQVFLFGSYAYGKPDKWSDIDLLVVTKKNLEQSYFDFKRHLRHLALEVDSRIEPHVCTVQDFKSGESLLALEVKEKGKKVF